MSCWTDWDFGCKHCDLERRSLDSSIKSAIGKNPCWGHTGYFIFELKDKETGKKGIFRFKNIKIGYRPTEICASVATSDYQSCKTPYCQECLPCNNLPASFPKGWTGDCNDFPDDPYEIWEGVELPVEVSTDGKTWTKIYGLPFWCRKGWHEQEISFEDYIEARFIRFRMPIDQAEKALTGYLDAVRFNIDIELIQEENNITPVEGGTITLSSSECLENIDGRADYSMPVYSPDECPNWGKYCFASGLHSTTWFAGFNKKWIIKKISGSFETVPYRGEENWFRCVTTTTVDERSQRDTKIWLQYSMDGVTWETVEIETKRGTTVEFEAEPEEPIEARYIRLAVKPRGWGDGSTPDCWLRNAELELELATPEEGKMLLTNCNIPDETVINEETNVYVEGEVTGGSVTNPAVAFLYVDGASPTITLIIDGEQYTMNKGDAVGKVKYGEEQEGYKLSANAKIIFPEKGTYTIACLSGKVQDNTLYYDDRQDHTITVFECWEGQQKCIGYDLYECINGEWQLIEENSPACIVCENITNKTQCEYLGCYWYNNSCHANPPTCEEINNKADCERYGCYWYNNACHPNPPTCEEINNRTDCIEYGCYWYDNACHSEPAPTPPVPEYYKWLPLLLIGGVVLGAVISRK